MLSLLLGIGESLFTIFASLAQAIQFLMELQINQFWILKVHSMINSANEYEPDVLNTSCATRAWKLKILQRMYELSTFATQRFCICISSWFPSCSIYLVVYVCYVFCELLVKVRIYLNVWILTTVSQFYSFSFSNLSGKWLQNILLSSLASCGLYIFLPVRSSDLFSFSKTARISSSSGSSVSRSLCSPTTLSIIKSLNVYFAI